MFQPMQLEGRCRSPLVRLGILSAHDTRALPQPMNHDALDLLTGWALFQPRGFKKGARSTRPLSRGQYFSPVSWKGCSPLSLPGNRLGAFPAQCLRLRREVRAATQLGAVLQPVSRKGGIAAHLIIQRGSISAPTDGWAISQPMAQEQCLSPYRPGPALTSPDRPLKERGPRGHSAGGAVSAQSTGRAILQPTRSFGGGVFSAPSTTHSITPSQQAGRFPSPVPPVEEGGSRGHSVGGSDSARQQEGRYCSPLDHSAGRYFSPNGWFGKISAHDSRAVSQPIPPWTCSHFS